MTTAGSSIEDGRGGVDDQQSVDDGRGSALKSADDSSKSELLTNTDIEECPLTDVHTVLVQFYTSTVRTFARGI